MFHAARVCIAAAAAYILELHFLKNVSFIAAPRRGAHLKGGDIVPSAYQLTSRTRLSILFFINQFFEMKPVLRHLFTLQCHDIGYNLYVIPLFLWVGRELSR